MKKFLFSILAVGAIVACTKSEVNYEDASEISFAPVASTATKAAIEGTIYPTNIPFNVFSFYAKDVEPGSVSDYTKFDVTYLNNKKFNNPNNSGIFSGSEHAYYWPKNGSLVFAGYSPCKDMIDSQAETYLLDEGLTITDYVQSNETQYTDDLMWFSQTKSSYRGIAVVPVKFIHACSWLSFYVTSATADADFHIKKLVLNDVKVKGTFNSKIPTWTLASDEADVVVMNRDVPVDNSQIKVDDDGVIVLPQSCVSATITYTMDNGAGVVVEQEQTFPLSAGTDGGVWKYARHYTYTIKFSADEILIAPAVNAWQEVGGTMVEAK